jgi:hypothetical protein
VKEILEAFILRSDQNFATIFSLVNGATAKLLAREVWVPIVSLARSDKPLDPEIST